MFPKSLYHSYFFVNDLTHSKAGSTQVNLHSFRKQKIVSQGKTQCWGAHFVISNAIFTKTAIKPKFVDIFSLKTFSAAIDRCTIKSVPEFRVHWKLFNLFNMGANLSKYWSDVRVVENFCVLPWFTCFRVFRNRTILNLRLAGCRWYKGYLRNEWVIETFRKHPNLTNLSAISPAFTSCIIYALFCRNSKISWNSSLDFRETSKNTRQAPKVQVASLISKEVPIRAAIRFTAKTSNNKILRKVKLHEITFLYG